MPRFFTSQPLMSGHPLELEASAARHVQVLRLQPGDSIVLFNGRGEEEGEYHAAVSAMGRSSVSVVVGSFVRTRTEATRAVHIAIGMPANDRMDWLVEKATELGVTSIAPLMTERSVLRLQGERLEKKVAHWRGVATAACEQCGRSRVPLIHAPQSLASYLKACAGIVASENENENESEGGARWLLSLSPGTLALATAQASGAAVTLLSGPEGGLSTSEEAAAHAAGFSAVSLGPRVLRSETAPLAALACLQGL